MVSRGLWLHMSKLRHAWTNCVDTKSASVNAIACEFQKLACPQTFDCSYRKFIYRVIRSGRLVCFQTKISRDSSHACS